MRGRALLAARFLPCLVGSWLFVNLSPQGSPRPSAIARDVGELLAGSRNGAVLLMDPSECVACSPMLVSWLDVNLRYPAAIHVALTRDPTSFEQRQLRVRGVKAWAVMSEGVGNTRAQEALVILRYNCVLGPVLSLSNSAKDLARLTGVLKLAPASSGRTTSAKEAPCGR